MTDINKLIERLRDCEPPYHGKCLAAATALQTLKEENERLRKALEPFAEAWDAEEYLCSSHWSSFYEASQALRALLPKETDNGR